MKIALLVVISLGLALANPVQEEYGTGQRKYKISDKQFLERQRDILRLFRNLHCPSHFKDHMEIAENYSIEKNIASYKNATVVKDFLRRRKHSSLARGEIFSVFHYAHLYEAIRLFKLLYFTKDYDTFYKTAVWARNNVNEGVFLYALSVAITHRPDTYGFILPPIYEIYPHFFFSSEVIEKAEKYKQLHKEKSLIYSNYSGYYLNLQTDQYLSYYLEDIGINSFYYYANIFYPFWLGGDEFKLKNDRRGERYFYLHKQILARYYLERLSNDYGDIEFLDLTVPFKCGYYPSLRYPNGLEFPARPNYIRLSEYFHNYGQSWRSYYSYSYTFAKDLADRLNMVADSGIALRIDGKMENLFDRSDGFEVYLNLVEANPDSINPRFYGFSASVQIYLRHLLGYSYLPLHVYKTAPSALEHFETSLRDPAFYRLYKHLVNVMSRYKYHLSKYGFKDLYFDGIKIIKIDFDRLLTYFDYFDSDITNAVYLTPEEYEKDTFQIKVRQQRLNHKPYTYRITVESDKSTEVSVRVYIGPKFDEYNRPININFNRYNFVEIDTFKYKLEPGENVIERNSRQSFHYVPDRTSYREIYKRIVGAIERDEELQMDASEAYYGYPNRFMLPKGRENGQTFQIYTIINPYNGPTEHSEQPKQFYFPRVGTGSHAIDNYAYGFPFDRPIDEAEFDVPNSKFQDVVIYHKSLEDMNATNNP